MILSLIVPIYNVELYIENCLKSIVSQLPEQGVEVILINDGTPDNSMKIVDRILDESHKRHLFKIINQSNSGVSITRNRGLDEATGDYIAFLDSDDMLYDGYFDKILKIIGQNDIDLIEFEAQYFRTNENRIEYGARFYNIFDEGQYNFEEVAPSLFRQVNWYLWLRIYKRELFENIRFPIGMHFEDTITLPFVLKRAKNIYILKDIFYGYRDDNVNSITRYSKNIDKNIVDLEKVLNKFLDVKDEQLLLATYARILNYYCELCLVKFGYAFSSQKFNFYKKSYKAKSENLEDFKNKYDFIFWKFGVIYLVLKLSLKKILRRN